MVFEYKGRKVSNSLSVFNYYKGLTGRSLEADIRSMRTLEKVLNDSKATEEDIGRAQDALPIDLTEAVQYIYYSMRCAAEKKELELSEVVDEVDVTDLADGSLQEVILRLVEVKKKEGSQAEKRGFVSRRRR